MKELFYTFLILCFTGTLNAQWTQITSGTYENLNDIQFVNANTGYAVGNAGVVLKSTNGGQNWITINTGSTVNNSSLSFLDSSIGYISQTGVIPAKILYTSNGGNSWSLLNSLGDANFNSLYFLNQSTGFGTDSYFGIIRTTNGGINWSAMSNYYNHYKSINFLNSTFGYCICNISYSRYLLSTTGSTWSSHLVYNTTDQSQNYLNSVDFITTTLGYTVGDSGKIYKTNDAGSSWTYQNGNTTTKLNAVKSTDVNKTITVGNNGIIKATSNGGTTWYNQNSTTTNNLNSIYMLNVMSGFVTGDAGTILKTTNGGVYVRKIEDIIPNKYELQQNYPNPFNPSTTIRFSIPKDDFVKINVYDINGKLISKLSENKLTVGTYETVFDATNLNSGIYFVRLEASNILLTKKISLIK
jgi:photosystem II stability/assembly factor-like uncharacterized protein